MAYDPSKDKKLATFTFEGEKTEVDVVVAQYNGGEAKVGMNRFYVGKNGERQWTKIGRLSMDEYLWLAGLKPEIQKAIRNG